MRRTFLFALAVALVGLLGGHVNAAEKSDDKEHAELAKALKGAKVF